MSFEFASNSLADTERFGAALAASLPPSTTVALCGTLGAGKTHLVQAIAAGCGVDRREVTSPTFVLCQHYHGTRTIHHVDAYRIRDEDEFFELGIDELMQSDALTIVEWGDKVADCLPNAVRIDIDVTGDESRLIRITSAAVDHGDWLACLQEKLSA